MPVNPDQNETHLLPQVGELRWIEVETEEGTKRVLQRFEWSFTLSKHSWFDIPVMVQKEIKSG